uniref:Putative ovule protein n=1 Tax=Solanum chacoense TaxID=4108 RepID=A0A0V0GTP0_SOLCH
MQVGDEEDAVNETEHNSKSSIDRVEERMRDCFIQNKSLKDLFPRRLLWLSSGGAMTMTALIWNLILMGLS